MFPEIDFVKETCKSRLNIFYDNYCNMQVIEAFRIQAY